MSYNGIGLNTPRGSGTNGYVVRNLSSIRKSQPYATSNTRPGDMEAPISKPRKADHSILAHEARRRLENRVLIYQTELEDAEPPFEEDVIERKVAAYRAEVEAEATKNGTDDRRSGFKSYQTHDIAIAKEKEMERMRSALGIRPNYAEGDGIRSREEK